MKKNDTKIILRIFFYIISFGLLVYIIKSIGIYNIIDAFTQANYQILFTSFLITIISSLLRLYKYKILIDSKESNNVLEIFTFSRLGKEVNFLGYFFPLIKKNNRTAIKLKGLLVDRYTEIFSTFLLAFISSFFVLNTFNKSHYIIIPSIFVLVICLVLLMVIPFLNLPQKEFKLLKKYSILSKIKNLVTALQTQLQLNKSFILQVYLISIIVTILDFVTVYYIFKSLNVMVSIYTIALIWSLSGIASILAFMIIGFNEISVIYLYTWLASVNKAVTTSSVILYKLINTLVISLFFLVLIITNSKKILKTKPALKKTKG